MHQFKDCKPQSTTDEPFIGLQDLLNTSKSPDPSFLNTLLAQFKQEVNLVVQSVQQTWSICRSPLGYMHTEINNMVLKSGLIEYTPTFTVFKQELTWSNANCLFNSFLYKVACLIRWKSMAVRVRVLETVAKLIEYSKGIHSDFIRILRLTDKLQGEEVRKMLKTLCRRYFSANYNVLEYISSMQTSEIEEKLIDFLNTDVITDIRACDSISRHLMMQLMQIEDPSTWFVLCSKLETLKAELQTLYGQICELRRSAEKIPNLEIKDRSKMIELLHRIVFHLEHDQEVTAYREISRFIDIWEKGGGQYNQKRQSYSDVYADVPEEMKNELFLSLEKKLSDRTLPSTPTKQLSRQTPLRPPSTLRSSSLEPLLLEHQEQEQKQKQEQEQENPINMSTDPIDLIELAEHTEHAEPADPIEPASIESIDEFALELENVLQSRLFTS